MFSDEDEDEDAREEDQESEEDSGLEDAQSLEDEDGESEDEEMDWEAAMDGSDAELDEEDESESDEEEDTEDSNPQPQESNSASPSIPSTTGKYIPPAARAAAAAVATAKSASSEAESAEIQKLRRQAQGQLNRLGENNIESILFALTNLYDSNRRADVSSTLTSLILETISARADLGNRFVVLYAALVGGLHRIVGVEFGAAIVQKVVEKLVEQYEGVRKAQAKVISESGEGGSEQVPSVVPNGKECVNLLILLSELYNLQIVGCPLIYDLIRLFLGVGGSDDSQKGMVDIDIELLLKIVRTCGQQLRHDDPTSLKSIISLTQESVSQTPSEHLGSRPRFMLETLTDLKNNRQRKGTGADANGNSSEELTQKMKKWLNGLSKKHTVRNFESLRVGLKDLQQADTKGKWWLVGAAWTGHQTHEDGNEGEVSTGNGMTVARPLIEDMDSSDEVTAQLLKEARKHGMNTDSKRKIFVAIMSAEDYVDAGSKLLQLKLNEVQRREIIRVLLHCLGQENVYNPYYTLIGSQLSQDSPNVRVTLQYSLWDFLRDLGEKRVGGQSKIAGNDDDSEDESEDEDEGKPIKGAEFQKIVNTARACSWWVAKGCLSLNALKVSIKRKEGASFQRQPTSDLLLSFPLTDCQFPLPQIQRKTLPPILLHSSLTFSSSQFSIYGVDAFFKSTIFLRSGSVGISSHERYLWKPRSS